uniref:Uncharacterized protein n=1 Tax=Lepeophtheirus salmonis TaxID=72036 RepID=A0A0K2TZ63_LEPSM
MTKIYQMSGYFFIHSILNAQ